MARFVSRSFVCSAILASTFVASAFSLAQTTASTPTLDNTRIPVKAQVPPPISAMTDLGPVAADLRIDAQMHLRRTAQQEVRLNEYKQQALRTSERMTPKQFGEAFGPVPADIAAVSAWLASHGLEVTRLSAGKLAMNFSGTAAQMEEAFQTEIHRYQSADGHYSFAPATPVSIPAAFSAIVYGPSGLSNFGARRQANYDGPVASAEKNSLLPPAPQASASATIPIKGITQYPKVGSVLDNARPQARPDLLTPTLTVALAPTTLAHAADGSTTITATLTYAGATPTGTVTYSDLVGLVNVSQIIGS